MLHRKRLLKEYHSRKKTIPERALSNVLADQILQAFAASISTPAPIVTGEQGKPGLTVKFGEPISGLVRTCQWLPPNATPAPSLPKMATEPDADTLACGPLSNNLTLTRQSAQNGTPSSTILEKRFLHEDPQIEYVYIFHFGVIFRGFFANNIFVFQNRRYSCHVNSSQSLLSRSTKRRRLPASTLRTSAAALITKNTWNEIYQTSFKLYHSNMPSRLSALPRAGLLHTC